MHVLSYLVDKEEFEKPNALLFVILTRTNNREDQPLFTVPQGKLEHKVLPLAHPQLQGLSRFPLIQSNFPHPNFGQDEQHMAASSRKNTVVATSVPIVLSLLWPLLLL